MLFRSREGRVFISSGTKPDFGASYSVQVLEGGAQVTSGSSGTTITVRAGHGFAAGDKVMRGTDTTTFSATNVVDSVTSTTVEMHTAYTVAAGDMLVNLGVDGSTGATPNYDGAGLTVYTTQDYTATATNNTVTTDSYGRYRYYHKGIVRWELVRGSSGPIALYTDTSGGGGSTAVFNVRDYGAAADGVTDDTIAFQATIDAAGSNATILVPSGSYKIISGGLLFSHQKTIIRGDGRGSTVITFAPTTAATLFEFNSGVTATILYQPTIRDIFLVGSGSEIKVAFKFVNVSNAIIEGVSCIGWGGGGASKFIVSQGREFLSVHDTTASGCDTVVHIQLNPDTAHSLVDCDHFNFHNCHFGCVSTTVGQIFLVDNEVYLSNFSCTGFNSWAGGKYGFYYVDTTSPTRAINVVFDNVRWEQSTGTGYGWYLSHGGALDGLSINNCQAGAVSGGNGLYFHNVWNATITNFRFDSNDTGQVMFNIDSSNLNIININPNNLNSFGVETVACTSYINLDAGSVTVSDELDSATLTTSGLATLASNIITSTQRVDGLISANGGIATNGGIFYGQRFNIGTWCNPSATSGDDTACTNGTGYAGSIYVPYNSTIVGVQFLIGSIGGTDKVIVSLHSDGGVLLANSDTAGTLVGTAATGQQVAFTAPYAIRGPVQCFILLTFNGNTAKFRTVPAHCQIGNGVIGNGVTQTFGTPANFIQPGAFYVGKVPIASLY